MNLLFTIQRPYHLLVSDAYARYIFDLTGIKAAFIISRFNTQNYNAEYADIIQLPHGKHNGKLHHALSRWVYGGWLFPFSKVSRNIDFSKPTILFVFNDLEPISDKIIKVIKRKSKQNHVVLIDEGVGTYSDSIKPKKTVARFFRNIITTMMGAKNQEHALGDNPLIDYAIVGNVEKYSLLKKACGQIVLPQSKRMIYEKSVAFVESYIGHKMDKFECSVNKSILYLGQPFEEFGGFISGEEDFLREIIKTIPNNVNIIVKPHPAESKDKYYDIVNDYSNVSMVSRELFDIPIECLINTLGDISAVISYFSSAGINIANIYSQIDAIFLYKSELSLGLTSNIQEIYSRINTTIFSSHYNNVYCPITCNDFVDIVKKGLLREGQKKVKLAPSVYPELDEILTLLK